MNEDADLTVGLLAAKFDDEYPDSAPEWVADTAVRNTPAAARRSLLVRLVEERIRARRREQVRLLEQASAVPNRNRFGFAELVRQEQEADLAAFLAQHEIDSICRTPHSSIEAAKGCASTLKRSGELDDRRLQRDDPEEWARQHPSPWESFRTVMEQYRADVRLELTAELLGSSFALGDGRRVTWGTASVVDHQQRIDLLQRQATGTAQTMILHEKAIDILTARSVACLNDARVAA